MEVYGIDNLIGIVLVVSMLNVFILIIIGVVVIEMIMIDNFGGNIGIVIMGISLGGDNVFDFVIVVGDLGIFLILVGGVY